jgi:hypothetical protein
MQPGLTTPLRRWAGLVLPFVLAACGSSVSGTGDAAPSPHDGQDVGATRTDGGDELAEDRPANMRFEIDASNLSFPDAGDGAGAGIDAAGDAAGSPTYRRLVSGPLDLIGGGAHACTNETNATGDRWCGFARAVLGDETGELWVINATRAAAGVAIRCDGSDPNCLLLSKTLFLDRERGPGVNGFDGDTLIYHEGASQSPDHFVGVIKAWRPGFAYGRQLGSNSSVFCWGQSSAAGAACWDNNVVTDERSTADLRAGSLADGATGLLPKVDDVLIWHSSDAEGVRRYQAALAPDGKHIAWSTRRTPDDVETLEVQELGDAASRKVVASDVTRWLITGDAKRYLWLAGFPHDASAPAGTLTTASFPSGEAPSPLATAVFYYQDVGEKGVLYQTVDDQLRLMPDLSVPASTKLIAEGISHWVTSSPDGTIVVYVKSISFNGTMDLYVRDLAAPEPCVLTATRDAWGRASLLAGNSVVIWNMFDRATSHNVGYATSVATCSTKLFATGIFDWMHATDRAVAFLETANAGTPPSTLRLATMQGGTLQTPPATIHTEQAITIYEPLPAAVPTVLFSHTARTTMADDGLYIYTAAPADGPPDASVESAGE